jgi:poly-beta-1,6-N-acetyl-D-glucosamine biosynthesis protein PgaD
MEPQPFVPPLILDAASRPVAARRRDALVTMVLWCCWLYLLVAAIGAVWVPPFVHHMLPVEPPESPWSVLRIALGCVLFAAALVAYFLVRVIAERRRFRGEDRRRAFPRPADEEIAADFGVAAHDLPLWRAARRMVVHHDEAGRILRVETGGPPG